MALEADVLFSGRLRHVKTTLNKVKFLRFQAGTREQLFPKRTTKFAAVIKFVTKDIPAINFKINTIYSLRFPIVNTSNIFTQRKICSLNYTEFSHLS